jgi:PAS domain S-box-containing protein
MPYPSFLPVAIAETDRETESALSDTRRLCLNATVLCALCYLGNKFGAWVKFPHIGSALFFPPYAFLTAALLMLPRRHWWACLVASFAGHFAACWPAWPFTWVVLAEGANLSRALIAAIGLGYFSRGSLRLDTLRGAVIFVLVAVLLAPAAAALIGATNAVLHNGTENFWLPWTAWFLSNAVTGITLLPAILTGILAIKTLKRPSQSQWIEAALLFGGLILSSVVVFSVGESKHAGATSPARLYAPLPFLIWAAVRFGPGGTSVAILGIAATVIWGASEGFGPFVAGTQDDNIISLYLFLLAVSLPVMMLSALLRERQRTEESLREYKNQVDLFFEHAPAAIAMFDRDMKYLLTSRRWLKDYRLSGPSIVGRCHYEVFPEIPQRWKDIHQRCLAGAVETCEEDCLPRLDGSVDWIRWAVHPWHHADGSIGGLIMFTEVVTERKRTEQEMEQQRKDLAHLTRVGIVGELSGAIAHELSQPLTAILTNAQAGRRFLIGNARDRQEVAEVLHDIERGAKRASSVMQRLRALLKRGETQFSPINLNKIVTEVLDLARHEFVSRGTRVETHLDPRLPLVRADRVALQQVVLNLVLNACDAMNGNQPGERQVSISTAVDRQGLVRASISDCGHGVSPDDKDRIFEPFYTTKEHGLGLGLSICRSIVQAHAGHLSAENNSTCGATFYFTLPVPKETQAIGRDHKTVNGS